ncbi:CHRD domain-containing protein [Spirosoma aerolatum]|uniref:CHRD domain-containing protein n=1 Tax=Spirosoma aerolatum TaxID=1211326 RepID=UPI001FEB253B|nr:CHRD domain-containing protein [Spirosoma aerolatum]
MKLANITLVFASVLACGLIACGNDENPTITSTKTTLTASLNGASEKPSSTSSAATGTFTGVVDESTRVLSYTVTYTGPFTSSLTAGHLHRITNTTALTGGVEIPFTSLVSPIII